MGELFDTLQVYLGSLYINDFNLFGRTWQVNVQGDAQFRRKVEDLKRIKFRGEHGQMVPFGALASVHLAHVDTGAHVVVAYYLAAIGGACTSARPIQFESQAR